MSAKGGYSPALRFLLVLQVGAMIGAVTGGWLSDRFGGRTVATAMLVIAAIVLVLLAAPISEAMTTLLVFISGATALGTQSVLFGYVATHYGHESRATALGLTAGIGRLGAAAGPLVGGLLAGAGVGFVGNVAVFAAAAVVAAVATVLVPRPSAASGSCDPSLSDAAAASPTVSSEAAGHPYR